jgi:hypothetical protein
MEHIKTKMKNFVGADGGPCQGGTNRAAVAAPLPGNFTEKPTWQEIS